MNPSIFNFNEHGVRVVLDDNQEPWFCLTDVCKVLDISRSSDLLQIQRGDVKNETPKRNGALDPKGVADYHTPTNGGIQKLKFINEPNLYRVIFRSNKKEALNFQNWVFAELTGKEHFNVKRDCLVMFDELELDALKFEGIYLDAQLEPLNFEGIVNSTTPNLNPMGYAQNWTHLKMFGGV